LRALDETDLMRADTATPARLRAVAREEFDLASVGRTRYRRLYDRLLNRS